MAREHPDYRNLMEQLNRVFPDRELLTMEEVMKFTGYQSANTVKKHYPMQRGRIKKVTLARVMCQ